MQDQKITTFLWFKGNAAEEAARFYVSLFPGAKIVNVNPMATTFAIGDQRFTALNGNPGQAFTEAVSLQIDCVDQAEVDRLWSSLTSNGGAEGRCGWCTDKYGVSWQVIPRAFMKLMGDPDPKKSQRVMQAMLQMNKLDVAALERAHAGK